MSYSLMVKSGDLVAQAGRLSIVVGAQKMLQDLELFVLTKMGSDQYNPGYGSLIDGGVKPNGVSVSSPIGTMQWSITEAFIEQEIMRIISVYQAEQNARMRSDLATYNKSTLSADEILTGVTGISFNANEDVLTVNIEVSNAAGNQFTISVPVEGTVL